MDELVNEDTLMKHFQLWRKKEKPERKKKGEYRHTAGFHDKIRIFATS